MKEWHRTVILVALFVLCLLLLVWLQHNSDNVLLAGVKH
jgi:preprotein translocase subunit SecG